MLLHVVLAFALAGPADQVSLSRLQKVLREKGVDALVEEVTRPQRAFWQRLKAGLAAADGATYFWNGVRFARLPEMSGFLISHSALEIAVGISDPGLPEVTLRLDAPLDQEFRPGSKVLFIGVASDFRPYPFQLILDVKRTNLAFLPANAGR